MNICISQIFCCTPETIANQLYSNKIKILKIKKKNSCIKICKALEKSYFLIVNLIEEFNRQGRDMRNMHQSLLVSTGSG